MLIGLTITGTLGILIKAHETGIMTDIMDVIDDLRKVHFCIPHGFEDKLLNR
jgi:predicted nucleic acid-binding protein